MKRGDYFNLSNNIIILLQTSEARYPLLYVQSRAFNRQYQTVCDIAKARSKSLKYSLPSALLRSLLYCPLHRKTYVPIIRILHSMARANSSVLPNFQMGCLHLGRYFMPCRSSTHYYTLITLLIFMHTVAIIAIIVGIVFIADFIHLIHVERIYPIYILVALGLGFIPLLVGIIVLSMN